MSDPKTLERLKRRRELIDMRLSVFEDINGLALNAVLEDYDAAIARLQKLENITWELSNTSDVIGDAEFRNKAKRLLNDLFRPE